MFEAKNQTERGSAQLQKMLEGSVRRAVMPWGRLLCAQLLAVVMVLSAFAVTAMAGEGEGGGGREPTSLSTTLSGGGKEGTELTVAEGTKIKDKATLSGKNAFRATGKVTYKIYSEKECKTLVASAGEVSLIGEGIIPASNEEELEAGRSYYWQAHYGGDTYNAESTSPCTEVLNVQAKTTLATKLSGESKEAEELTIAEGAKAKDKATLSGTNFSTATGEVIYKIYSEKECKTLVKEAGEVKLEREAKIPASLEEELEAGKAYYWQATYKGDALHKESTSTCGKEILNVQAKTILTTKLSGGGEEGAEIEVPSGTKLTDHATLSGTNSSTATGRVVYKVYSDKECKMLLKVAGEVVLESGAKIPASLEEELEAGKAYYWQATYNGDTLHKETTSTCGAEISYVGTLGSGSWSLLAPLPTNVVYGVSCMSASACVSPAGAAIQHWNGSKWTRESVPLPGGLTEGDLSAVICQSSTECIGVGAYTELTGTKPFATRLVEGEWRSRAVSGPEAGTFSLAALSCASESACIAIGGGYSTENFISSIPFAEIWNGIEWKVQTLPEPSETESAFLNKVSCSTSTSCMAVGGVEKKGANTYYALAEFWNGTEWKVISTPTPEGATFAQFESVACPSSSACFAVGYYSTKSGERTLAEHWNGSEWQLTTSTNTADETNRLAAVSCTSHTACIATGFYGVELSNPTKLEKAKAYTLAERWNGTEWLTQTIPNPSEAKLSELDGLACVKSGWCMSVGFAEIRSTTEPLVEKYE